jgi:hypothetical protein
MLYSGGQFAANGAEGSANGGPETGYCSRSTQSDQGGDQCVLDKILPGLISDKTTYHVFYISHVVLL